MNRAAFAAVALAAAALSLPATPATATPVAPRAVADFNRDGYGDLAIGAPGYGTGGAVVVMYGTASGLRTAGAQLWHRELRGVPGTASDSGGFGGSVASGDFDGDGYADLAVGAPGMGEGRGTLTVLYGGGSGLTTAGAELWSIDTPGVPGASTGWEQFGAALAVGDFNRDRRDDLAIGARGGSHDTASETYHSEGGVWVMYGANDGLRPGPILRNSPGGVHSFGAALAAGDFDGDGADDLAAGAPGHGVVTSGVMRPAAGRVFVYPGAAGTGISATRHAAFDQQSPGVNGGAEPGDQFGAALAAGDFDGNGRDDLAVGVPTEDVNGVTDAGAVHVLRGSASGLTGYGQFWHQDMSGVPGRVLDGTGSGSPDYFGAALATGDFTGDLRADLAIGTPSDPVPSRATTEATAGATEADGTVTVLKGSGTGLTTSGAQYWHADVAGVPGVAEAGDGLGAALGTGDFDGNRRADLAVGVPREQVGADRIQGAAVVLYARSGGLGTTGAQQWHQDVAGVPGAGGGFDYFGAALAG
ncbi:MAG TPA: hypothetical protein VNA20_16645 [Frankiaceae bacterium]|nr:hypothetical protein [Frankiaceae bacterium]